MAACERAAYLFDVPVEPVRQEALWLLQHPEVAPDEFTVEQIEGEREVMYDSARKRGIPLEAVKPEIDQLVDALKAAVEAQRGRSV